MNTVADVDIIEINDEQAQNAKLLASAMSSPQIRKRAMIDMLGISCAVNYLRAKKVRVDTKRSVYKIPILFEEFKLTDIYFGNYRIDVITLYKEKTVKIPKIHVDMDIMPHFYFVVQIGAKIKEAKMIGFIDSKNVSRCSHDSKYYYPTLDLFFDLDKFISYTRQSVPSKTLLGKHIDCLGLFLKFIDNDLSSVYKRQLINHLMNCDSCRSRFIDTIEFEKLANNIRHYPNLIKKYEARTKVENIDLGQGEQSRFIDFEEGLNNLSFDEDKVENLASNEVFEEETPKKDDYSDKSDSNRKAQMFDIASKTDKKQLSKNVIDSIFNEIPKVELPQIRTIIGAKQKRFLMIIVMMFFVLGSFALISIKGAPDISEQNNEMSEFEEFDENYSQDYSNDIQLPNLKQNSNDNFVINQPVSTKPQYTPTITEVSWEAPESLIKKASYTKFLQMTGKNIKLNLQNDLLLISDVPINKNVKVDIKIAASGEVEAIKMVKQSGSENIDNSIKRVINDTLTYMKPPSHGIISKPVVITLSVNLN